MFGKKTHNIISPTIKSMLNPTGKIFIFTRNNSKDTEFLYQGLGRPESVKDSIPVRIVWSFFDDVIDEYSTKLVEDELIEYYEGAREQRFSYTYDRNAKAQQSCIKYYGFNCVLCNFNFENKYGTIGKEYIRVHHLIEISQIGKEYIVDPIKDLRPVCPNCHAMLPQKNHCTP